MLCSRASCSGWPRLSRAGGTIIKTTVDHALSFLCLGASVGKYPADSGREGSPGRDRASSLAQFWIDALSAMTLLFVMSAIDLSASRLAV
jgi:hypothetical protein